MSAVTVNLIPPTRRLAYLHCIPISEALSVELNIVMMAIYNKIASSGVLPDATDIDELTYLHCARLAVQQSLRQ